MDKILGIFGQTPAASQPRQRDFATVRDIGQKNARVFIEWRALTCPKAEYTLETTEDRYAERAAVGLFAVADGVGASFRAAEWAQAVVDAWVKTPFHSGRSFEVEWWLRKLQPGFVMRAEEIAALQPYAQAAARRGAGCTFLGLRMWPTGDGKGAIYSVLCAGDSDLLHYPVQAFPIFSPDKFGSYPTVLRSKGFERQQDRVLRYPDSQAQAKGGDGQARQEELYARLRPQETLMLCTDAIAHWALETDNWAATHEDAMDARTQLEQQTQETWPAFVEELRHTKKLVDDDTTVLFIRIAHDQKSPVSGAPEPEGWRRVELSYPAIARVEDGWVAARRSEMAEALQQKPSSAIEVARIYGDGRYFSRNYKDAQAVRELVHRGRDMARALDEINAALRAVSWDNPTREQVDTVAELKRKYGELLRDEPSAKGALTTMSDLLARLPAASARPQPAAPPAGMGARPQSANGSTITGEQPAQPSAPPLGGAPPEAPQSEHQGNGLPDPTNSEAQRGS